MCIRLINCGFTQKFILLRSQQFYSSSSSSSSSSFSSFRVSPIPRYIQQPNVPKRSSNELRELFIDYFKSHQHEFVPPSSVIAKRNEGSYFVNAGVNQFKKIILGKNQQLLTHQEQQLDGTLLTKPILAAVNSQRCIRMSGKHNDLDDVGWDAYHHTSFEMFGNWSFGSYYKKEMCELMWNFLTKILKLPTSQLYFTIFNGSRELGLEADNESLDAWLRMGVKDNKLMSFGADSNLWLMGPNGVGGVCTEVHFDILGSSSSRCARCFVNAGSPEVIELWNSVFISHEIMADGHMRPLSRKFVDTGMGLERLAAIVQGVSSNYDTDLYAPIINHLNTLVRQRHSVNILPNYSGSPTVVWPPNVELNENQKREIPCSIQSKEIVGDEVANILADVSYRIVADHMKTLMIASNEGLLPHRQDVGLKLRHLIGRLLFHGCINLRLTVEDLCYILPTVSSTLTMNIPKGGTLDWPDLNKRIEIILHKEANQQLPLLEKAIQIFQKSTKGLPFGAVIQGDHVKQMVTECDEIGYDLISALSRYHGYILGNSAMAAYQQLQHQIDSNSQIKLTKAQIHLNENMKQIQLSNTLQSRGIVATKDESKYSYKLTKDGNYHFPSMEAKVLAILSIDDQVPLNEVGPGYKSQVYLCFDKTSFYAESGGQAADHGIVMDCTETKSTKAEITNVFKLDDCGVIVHVANPMQKIHVGDKVSLQINENRRLKLMQHHTASHLLHWAIDQELAENKDWILQVGSNINENQLSLTISCLTPISLEMIQRIEQRCQTIIDLHQPVSCSEVHFEEAKQLGAIYMKSSSYPDRVRVIHVANNSIEVCGGTHVVNTAHLQRFVITACQRSQQTCKEFHAIVGENAEEAHLLSVGLITSCQQIEKACQEKNWIEASSLLEMVDHTLTKKTIGKYVRTQIAKRLSPLRPQITGALRRPKLAQVKQDRLQALGNLSPDSNIVAFKLDNLHKVIRDISQQPPQRPCLFVDNHCALLFVPATCSIQMDELIGQLVGKLTTLGENVVAKTIYGKIDSNRARLLLCRDGSGGAGDTAALIERHKETIQEILSSQSFTTETQSQSGRKIN